MSNSRQKNYLRSCRKKLGLYQLQVAFIIGKSESHVSALENGNAEPTTFECAVFEFLFARNFGDLWPRVHDGYRLLVEGRVRRLMDRLETVRIRSDHHRKRVSFVKRQLEALVDDVPDKNP